MASGLFSTWNVAQRYGAIAALAALMAFASTSTRSYAQGSVADDEQAPTQIAATHTPGAFGDPLHAPAAAASANDRRGAATHDLRAYWVQSDVVARSTLICLAMMLIGASYVLGRRLWEQQLLLRSAQTVSSRFWTAPNLYEAVRNLETRSAFRAIAEHGLEAAAHREGRLTDRIAADDWIATSLQRSVSAVNARLHHGLGFLETIGSTAPFVGLFGTVWGIHQAFGGATGDEPIAAPIGAALLMTAAGLVVAVLAIAGRSWLARRNETAIDAVRDFAEDVEAVLLAADAALHEQRSSRRS